MTDHENKEQALIPYREPVGVDAVKAFIPGDFPSVFRFSQLLAESGDMVPKAYVGNPAKISTAIFFGYEIGLLPLQALQSIAVINGKPSIYGDAALALVRGSGLLEDFEEVYEGDFFDAAGKPNPNHKAVCKVTRRGAKRPTISEFSIGDAMMAGLWNKDGPWRTYPKRMLKMRARAFGLRDEFTDVLRGIGIAEEVSDYDMKDITPDPTDKEPPAPTQRAAAEDAGEPVEKAKRGRKAKPVETGNAYQGDGKEEGDKVEAERQAAEVLEEIKSEDPPAPTNKAAPKVIEQGPVKEETNAAAPKQDDANTAFMDALMSEVGPDRQLKDYLNTLNKLFAGATDIPSMKTAWEGKPKPKEALTPKQTEFVVRVRDWHKARIKEAAEQAAADENPPAPGEKQGEPVKEVLDFPAFIHGLDEALAQESTMEGVNKVYADITSIPINDGMITPEEVEGDLKPILAEHLERVSDFGS